MVEEETTQATDGIFIVRQGEGAAATYAICARLATVDGSHQISGTTKTVAQYVDEQHLEAAFVKDGKGGGVRTQSFQGQSGQNFSLVQAPR